MKTKFIVNPKSANGSTGKVWNELEKIIKSEGFNYTTSFTNAPGNATILTKEAINDNYDMIVSVGGDGTMNEVVNGFFEPNTDKLINPNVVLGVISRGTGCDFIKTLKIPKNNISAIKRLKNNDTRTIDIGRLTFINHNNQQENRYFANVVSAGLGGEVDKRVNNSTKAFGGFVSFLWATLITVLSYKNRVINVTIDDKSINAKSPLIAVANGRYFGGGMFIAPNAEIDDGEFDVIVLGDLNTIEIFWNINRIYKGTHLTHPKIQSFRGKKIRIASSDELLIDMDGEQPGKAPLEFSIIPKALKVKV